MGNFVTQIEDFGRAVEEAREHAATGLAGLRVVEIPLAAVQSAREGGSVQITAAPL